MADRWHLFHNLAEAVERVVAAHCACLREPGPPQRDAGAACAPAVAQAPPDATALGPGRLRDRVHQRHAAVHELLDQGRGIKQIARDLGLAIGTVRRYARAQAPGEMLHDQWQHRASPLDGYKDHLRRRLAEGATNAAALYREIKALGYRGTCNPVRVYVRSRRPDKPPAPVPPPSVRAVTGYLTRHPAGLGEDERKQRADILERCPELNALARYVQAFAEMMADRAGHLLDAWITDAQESGLAPLASFAAD